MTTAALTRLGWSPFFASQLDADEIGTLTPLRIAEVHRTRLHALGADGPIDIVPPHQHSSAAYAVGDWVLLDDHLHLVRTLDRKSLLHRIGAGREPGGGAETQRIAANVDTLFITTSCNADFNVARLERYLALAAEAGTRPVVILTKADLTDDPEDYRRQAQALQRGLVVLTLDARDPGIAADVADWCHEGQTVALVGSSGVGKSTLMNTLAGLATETAPIRENDARGRHTTTHRALRPLSGGGWIIDTPGMRSLQLTGAAEGIDAVFAEIAALVPLCRFRDCAHDREPGCALQAAVAAGTLDPDRLERWKKLKREDRAVTRNAEAARAAARKAPPATGPRKKGRRP